MYVLCIITIIILTCGGTNFAAAQYKFDKPIVIGREHGLPGNDVRCVRKGENGFVWIGTADGLCRYDGQFVKVFTAGDDPHHSLFDNTINAILPLKHSVWVGTSQGVSVLDTRTNTFKNYQFENGSKAGELKRRFDQHTPVLFRDRAGVIWIGTATTGVCAYDESKDDFRFYSFPRELYPALTPSLGSDVSILSITEASNNDSVIWAGTPAGLQKVNKFTGQVKLYTFERANKDSQVSLNAFRRLYQHDDGLLYAGSWAESVNVFDPVRETFTPLPRADRFGQKVLNSTISNIARKSDTEIWISSGAGLAVYNTKLKKVTWYRLNDVEKNEFVGVDFIDGKNRVWLKTNNSVQYYDPAVQQFAQYSFKHLSHVLWAAYAFYILYDSTGSQVTVCPRQTDGLYRFDRNKKEWTKISFANHWRFDSEIEAIRGFVQLDDGAYLISSDKGLVLFSPSKQSITKLDDRLPFPLTRTGELLKDSAGYVWMPDGDYGLVKWRPGTREYTSFKLDALRQDGYRSARLSNLFRDRRGNIWFQTAKGIGILMADERGIVHFPYSENQTISLPSANSFAEDKRGRVWVNGSDGWLGYGLSTDPGKGLVKKFNIRERQIVGTILSNSPRTTRDRCGVIPTAN